MKYNIGCSGFHYKHWKGGFYPIDLPEKKWFEFMQSTLVHWSSILLFTVFRVCQRLRTGIRNHRRGLYFL